MSHFLVLLVLLFSLSNQSFAEVNVEPAVDLNEPREVEFDEEKLNELSSQKKKLLAAKNEIDQLSTQLKKTKDSKKQYTLKKEIERITDRYRKLKSLFVSAATNVDLDQASDDIKVEKRNVVQEIQELVLPAVDGIKRISERPRKIEAIKSEIASFEEKIRITEKAERNISLVIQNPDTKPLLAELLPELNGAKDHIHDLKEGLVQKRDRLKRLLTTEQGSTKTVGQAVTDTVKGFLQTKGRNLLFAFVAFTLMFFSLSKIRHFLARNERVKKSLNDFYKPVMILLSAGNLVISLGAAILTLQLLNDWVMVTAILLFGTFLVWSSKDILPKYLSELTLILNLGSVKENQVLMIAQIPWKVKSLGFTSVLENRMLDVPQIKMPAQELVKLFSREEAENEIWFPSRKGEYVLLSDQSYGKVKFQSQDFIVLELKGGVEKTLKTSQFFDLQPQNFSKNGFWIEVTWGLDYGIQKKLLPDVLPRLRAELTKTLPKELSDFEIDFSDAASSSLNVWARAKIPGERAPRRDELTRIFKSVLLNASNSLDLSIPFQTVSVHLHSTDLKV